MMELTKKQSLVLKELWLHPSRRFSDMMSVTGLTSDDFKYYVRKFLKLGLITKNTDGKYELTLVGKELANRYDYDERKPIHMPKLTTVVFLRRNHEKRTEYLFLLRKRQPFYDFWGVIGRPVRVGEKFEEAGLTGLEQQTGLRLPLQLKGFYRQLDIGVGDNSLEDKLFVVFQAEWDGGDLKKWPYADHTWMTLNEFKAKEKRFGSAVQMIEKIEQGQLWFIENKTRYQPSEF